MQTPVNSFKQALAERREAWHVARLAADGVELQYLAARREQVDALRDSADKRLGDFDAQLANILDNDLVAALQFRIDVGASRRERRTIERSNIELVVAAKGAVDEARREVDAGRLQALGYSEVSDRLHEWCAKLAPLLAPLDLNPPSLSAADAEVGPPMTRGGASAWVVEEVRHLNAEGRAARTKALMAKMGSAAKRAD